MKTSILFVFAVMLTLSPLGCESDEDCFNDPQSCDDGDPCTEDYCDFEDGMCKVADKDCSDEFKCTADTCDPTIVDPETGELGACIHKTVTCDDEDPCTADACNEETGSCINTSICDDGNPCTTDLCDPETQECNNEPVEDGTDCTDGLDFTTGSCKNGVCMGGVTGDRMMFRVESLTLDTPEITFDLGNGPVKVNDLVGAFLTARVQDFTWGGAVFVLGPLDEPLVFGEGACTFGPGGEAEACALLPWGGGSAFGDVMFSGAGSCVEVPDIPAPCFLSKPDLFDLHALLPREFPDEVEDVYGFVTGSFFGEPIEAVEPGYIEGFIPKDVVDVISADNPFMLGDQEVTLSDLLADVEMSQNGDVQGYTVWLGFIAESVDSLALPKGCNDDPSKCEEGTTCNPFTGDCS